MLQSQMNWKFINEQREKDNQLDIVSELLHNRGITDSIEIERFLKPQLVDLHNPDLLDGLEKSKERIIQAIDDGESILVFGDYDADGVTATALLVETLHELGAMCDYYIPNRFTEGYGPNIEAFKAAKEQGFDLIITVDTGIAAFEAADVAKDLGIDLIITDHHEVQERLPTALAIVHPKLSDNYPFKELAGVGVAFKLAHYLLGYFPEQYLDLVAIGTIADLVPLINENRILVKYGLAKLTHTKRPGLVALKEVASIKGEVDEQDVGFAIGPRLNAAGRLDSAYPAVELLLTNDQEEAQQLANEINIINQERQQIVNDIADEAIEMVNQNIEENKSVIVVAKEGWNEGVLGIVASKLVRVFQRPAICLVLKPDTKTAKGSARSIAAFDMFENCMEIRDLFIQFGGHAQAAGMTLVIDQVDILRESLNQLASKKLEPEDYKEQLDLELKLDIDEVTIQAIEKIAKLAPFGMKNPEPLVYLRGKPSDIKQIGAKKNHLKFMMTQNDSKVTAVGFGFGDRSDMITPYDELEIVGNLQVNEWNGTRSPQILVRDLRIKDRQLFDYRGSKFWLKNAQHLESMDHLCVYFQNAEIDTKLKVMSYDELKSTDVRHVSELVLLDQPKKLSDLTHLLTMIKPNNIYVCYSQDQQNDWSALPTRDDFKWFYGFLLKRGKYNHTAEQKLISQHRGWHIKKIEFIINVFYELKFVKIEEGVVLINKELVRRDLTESNFYKKALKQKEVQDVLYYSNHQQLKSWLNEQIELVESLEEEDVHGL